MIQLPGIGAVRVSAAFALTVKIAAALVAFIASVIFARVLGPRGFGAYAVVVAWVTMLGTFNGLGYPQFILREGAKSGRHANYLRQDAQRRVNIFGLIPAALLIALGLHQDDYILRVCFFIASPLPILTALASVQQAAIQSREWIVQSVWPSTLAGPITNAVAFTILWLSIDHVTAAHLVSTYAVSLLVVILIYFVLVRRLEKFDYNPAENAKQETWVAPALKAVMPFMILAGTYLLLSRLDLVMLGMLADVSEAGSYAVAARAAELLIFVGMALVGFLAPRISLLHHEGRKAEIQKLLNSLGLVLAVITIPPALVMFVFSEPLLGFLYGEPYSIASAVLRVLVVAQVAAVLGGPLGTILNMTGLERIHLIVMVWALVMNVALNFLLIPRMGAMGAAIATLSTILASRMALLIVVRSKLGLKPSAIGL